MAEKVLVSFEVDNAGAIRAVKQFRGELGEVPASANKVTTGLTQLKTALAGVGAVFAAIGVAKFAANIVQLGSAVIGTGAKFETLAVQLRAVMGSSAGAGQALAWIKDFTLATPYQLEQVTNAFVKLKAMGLNPMSGALQAVADATSYLGGSAETMNSLVLALGKSFTVGKMSMEEMRMMMEKGVPVIDILADKLGVSAGEILKMSEAGKIGRNEIGLLIDAMREMYGGASAELMNTFAGKWSNLRDQIDKTLDSLANTGALELAKGALDIMISGLEKASEMFEELAKNSDLTKLTASLQELARATETLSQAVTSSNVLPFFFALGQIKLANDIEKLAGATRMLGAATEAFTKYGGGAQGIVSAIVGMGDAARENARDVYQMARSHQTAGERAAELVIQANRNIDALKLLNKSLDGHRSELKKLYSQQENSLEIAKDLEYQAKLNADADKYWLEQTKKGFEEVQKELDEYIATMQIPIVIPAPPTAPVINAFAEIGSSFSDLLGKGFMGELESFSDLWDAIWQDLAKSMMGILGDAFEKAFKDGGSIKDVWGSFQESVNQNRLAAGVGGVGMMYSGNQQGGAGGALQGAMGGMMAGAIFGPIGAAVGAVVGGIVGALGGGGNAPRAAGSIGMTGGSLTTINQDMSRQAEGLWVQQRVEEYRGAVMQMNDVLRLFGEGDLFDLIGDAPTFTFGGGSNPIDQLAEVFRNQWLPDAMRQMFRTAINRGLGGLGVDAETRQQLWREVGALSGQNQIQALETFISSLVNLTNLYDDMNWNAILDETRQDSLSAFLGGMGDALSGVQNQMLGLDSMTLLERADQATTIEQLIVNARQAEIQFLMQIDQLQKGINASIDAQIEGIRTGGMSETQAANYYALEIQEIMEQMRAGITSPEMAQQLVSDLQRYISSYSGVLGDDIYSITTGGVPLADHLVNILEEARGLSNEAFDAMRDQIRESNDALVVELQRLIEALTHFGDTVASGGTIGEPPQLDITGQFSINVNPSPMFETWVDARIERAWQEKNYTGPN